MKSSIILLIALFFSINALSQLEKHVVEIGGSGGISPGFISDLFGSDYYIYTDKSVSTLNQRKARYNGVINAGYTFLTGKRFGIGVRLSYQQMRIPVRNYDYYFNSALIKRESPVFNSFSTLFVMKFTPRNSILPFGLEHTIGIGPRFYRMANRPYHGSYIDSSGSITRGVIPQVVNMDLANQRYKGVELVYGLELNFPLAVNNFISIGFDFHGSFLLKSSYQAIEEPNYNYQNNEENIESIYYNRSYADELSIRALFSVLHFKIGYKMTL